MTTDAEALLLDTHAIIWLVDQRLTNRLVENIAEAAFRGQAFVSPISAWEIGLLAKRIVFEGGPLLWFDRLLGGPVRLTPITPKIAIGASLLPDWTHRDPADRILVATARAIGATLVTRDTEILRYGKRGHVNTIAC